MYYWNPRKRSTVAQLEYLHLYKRIKAENPVHLSPTSEKYNCLFLSWNGIKKRREMRGHCLPTSCVHVMAGTSAKPSRKLSPKIYRKGTCSFPLHTKNSHRQRMATLINSYVYFTISWWLRCLRHGPVTQQRRMNALLRAIPSVEQLIECFVFIDIQKHPEKNADTQLNLYSGG